MNNDAGFFIKHVAEASLKRAARSIARDAAPNGEERQDEWVALNPRRNDKTLGSFCLNQRTGRWSDFATGDSGGDLVSYMAYCKDWEQLDAANYLAERYLTMPKFRVTSVVSVSTQSNDSQDGDSGDYKTDRTSVQATDKVVTSASARQLVKTIPAGAPPPPSGHYRHGVPSARYEYHHANGDLAFLVDRYDKPSAKKQFSPVTLWWNQKTGAYEWQFEGYGDARPLHNLPALAEHLSAIVVICEGEKAAISARKLFPSPDFVPVTWSGGATSYKYSDWAPLKDRHVLLWADNDDAGRKAMSGVENILIGLGCINIEQIRTKVNDLPKGFDAADAVDLGWTAENILDHIERCALPTSDKRESSTQDETKAATETKIPVPPGFSLSEKGVLFYDEDSEKHIWICSRLDVTAAVRDVGGASWGRLLEFCDIEGRNHRWGLPMSMLGGSGEEFRRVLLDLGLQIAPGTKARNLLAHYLQMSKPARLVRCVATTGWHCINEENE